MSTEYEPGTVAIATVRGAKGVRVVLTDGGAAAWMSVELADGCRWHYAQDLTDVRPLVVLDLDIEKLRHFVKWVREEDSTSPGAGWIDAILSQIESQTKPPRIPEPGLWGVVEATRAFLDGKGIRTKWVRVVTGVSDEQWFSDEAGYATWDLLIDPTLVREGLS